MADSFGYQPVCKAGDAVLFTEAVLHGATVRNFDNERRVALIRFAPPTCAYARGYLQSHDFLHLLTPGQKAVVEAPFHLDQDRLVPIAPGEAGTRVARPRRLDKKEFDRVVFGHDYY